MIRKFFADSNFLTGFLVENDSYHATSQEIYKHLKKCNLINDFNDFYISNYVLTETIHNLQGKKMPYDELIEGYELLKKCKVFHVKVKEIDEAFKKKIAPYRKHKTGIPPPIGIVDATNLIIMDKVKNMALVSFDAGYDSIPDPFLIRIYSTKVIDERILRRYS